MTTESGCRVSSEELAHDRATEDRSARRDALYLEKCQAFRDQLTQGEIAEACGLFADMDGGQRIVEAYRSGDLPFLGMMVNAAISSWIAIQASKEVERVIDRGDV